MAKTTSVTVVMVKNSGLTVSVSGLEYAAAIERMASILEESAGRPEPERFGKLLLSSGTSLVEYGIQEVYRLAKGIKDDRRLAEEEEDLITPTHRAKK